MITITKAEWTNYETCRLSGDMNMMFHPLISKFMYHYDAAREHFEEQGNEDDLAIEEE